MHKILSIFLISILSVNSSFAMFQPRGSKDSNPVVMPVVISALPLVEWISNQFRQILNAIAIPEIEVVSGIYDHVFYDNNSSSLESFQNDLMSSAYALLGQNSLTWHNTNWESDPSDVEAWRTRQLNTWKKISNGNCWELLGILLLHNGYSRNHEFHNILADWYLETLSQYRALRTQVRDANLDFNVDISIANLEAGDIVLINEGTHMMIANGHGAQVFSLWCLPVDGLSLIDLANRAFIEYLHEQGYEELRFQVIKVRDLFDFVETLKSACSKRS